MQRGFRSRGSRLSRLISSIADSFNRFLARVKSQDGDFQSAKNLPFLRIDHSAPQVFLR